MTCEKHPNHWSDATTYIKFQTNQWFVFFTFPSGVVCQRWSCISTFDPFFHHFINPCRNTTSHVSNQLQQLGMFFHSACLYMQTAGSKRNHPPGARLSPPQLCAIWMVGCKQSNQSAVGIVIGRFTNKRHCAVVMSPPQQGTLKVTAGLLSIGYSQVMTSSFLLYEPCSAFTKDSRTACHNLLLLHKYPWTFVKWNRLTILIIKGWRQICFEMACLQLTVSPVVNTVNKLIENWNCARTMMKL